MQPTAEKKNRRINKTSRMVREVDQPVRQRRSAKSIDASPVRRTAVE
jgi:hypothetical protein